MRPFIRNVPNPILIFLGIALFSAFHREELAEIRTLPFPEGSADMKQAAFRVLQAKCNVCHQKKNPRRVFSPENMSELAPKIYKQVFIRKRMPRGNEFRLTREEYYALKQWLTTENLF